MRHGDYVALDPSEVKHMDEGAKAVRPDRGAKARQIVEAWLKIAEHPFFASCYHTDEPLLDSMLAKLSAARAERDAVAQDLARMAARLAAVEALADQWDEKAAALSRQSKSRAGLSDAEMLAVVSEFYGARSTNLRAVLSATPTDTKETS